MFEELSRTVWAPAQAGSQIETRWYYERARGSYSDALSRAQTTGERNRWKLQHPISQKFTKTDLAKFENTWDQKPHIVSRGAEKNFVEFMAELMDGRPKLPDEIYFRHLVALAILFRQSERIVQSQKFGGYRANIVTYSLAWLSHNTAQRLDLDRIWKSQAVPQPLEESIRVIAKAAYDHLVDGAQGGNVTEWAKKERCWETFRTSGIPLSENMTASMLIDQPTGGVNTSAGHHDSPVKANVPTEVHFRTAEDWFGIARWAKETANLQPWQRSLAYSLGKIVERGKEPSSKQVQQGIKILSEAERLGFRFDSA